jgi:hypothetical protein
MIWTMEKENATPSGTGRWAIAACFLLAICGVSGFADETENDSGRNPLKSPGSIPALFSGPPIAVKFSGPLELGSSMNADADFQDLSARKLTDADVIAGGTTIHLDWSRSSRIRDELLWWTIPRAGDARSPYAEVTGHLKFMPLKDLDQSAKVVPPGVSPDTPVPVVVVETIRVRLAFPDGTIRGPQPKRERVVAEDVTIEWSQTPEPLGK